MTPPFVNNPAGKHHTENVEQPVTVAELTLTHNLHTYAESRHKP